MPEGFGCSSCDKPSFSFGKRGNPQAARAMRLYASGKAKSLKSAWKMVIGVGKKYRKSGRKSRKSGRKSRKSRGKARSQAAAAMKLYASGRAKSLKAAWKVVKGSRGFGMVKGPGFNAQTSYKNAYAPYFGSFEPYVNASNWWYPYSGNKIQSPQMLLKSAGKNSGPGN